MDPELYSDPTRRLALIRLAEDMQEYARMVEAGGVEFWKFTEDQQRVVDSQSRIILITSGNRRGKTVAALGKATEACLMRDKAKRWPYKNGKAWIWSDDHDKNRDSLWPILNKMIPPSDREIKKDSLGHIHRILFKSTGWEMGLKSYKSGRTSAQGPSVEINVADERPPEDIWKELEMRGSTVNGQLIMTNAPVEGVDWTYRKLWLPAQDPEMSRRMGIEHIELNPQQAWWFSKEEDERLRHSMSPADYAARVLGRYVHRQGLVYDTFNTEVHVCKPFALPEGVRIYEVIDPGTRVFAVGFYFVHFTGAAYMFDEIYVSRAEARVENIKLEIMKRRRIWGYDKPSRQLIDPAGTQVAPGQLLSVVQQFNEGPDKMFPLYANNTKLPGKLRLKDYLAFAKDEHGLPMKGLGPALFVFSSCQKMIFEFTNHVYAATDPDTEDDREEEKNDHLIDCTRYFVMDLPRPKRLQETVPMGMTFDQARKISGMSQLGKKRLIRTPYQVSRSASIPPHIALRGLGDIR